MSATIDGLDLSTPVTLEPATVVVLEPNLPSSTTVALSSTAAATTSTGHGLDLPSDASYLYIAVGVVVLALVLSLFLLARGAVRTRPND